MKRKRKSLLKKLEKEKELLSEDEGYVKANNYGNIFHRFTWKTYSQNGEELNNTLLVTTQGLVFRNQEMFPLKISQFAIKENEYFKKSPKNPLEKILDLKHPEIFNGLVPFEGPLDFMVRHSFTNIFPFLFNTRSQHIYVKSKYIDQFNLEQRFSFIIFDLNKLKIKTNSDQTKKIRAICIPVYSESTAKTINEFIGMLEDVANKLKKDAVLNDPIILKNLRRKYLKKFRLENELAYLDETETSERKRQKSKKHDIPINNGGHAGLVSTNPNSKISEHNESKPHSRNKKTKKKRNLVVWDTSHYESVYYQTDVKKLFNLIKTKKIGLKTNWLKGDWKDQLLKDKKLLKKTKIIVITGMKSEGKISTKELTTIDTFVKEGGALLLTAPIFEGKDTNLLAKRFGAEFIWEKIEDEKNHEGKHSDHVLISNFIEHPLTKDVKEVCFGDYGGFPIKTKKQSVPLAYTSEDAKPSKALVLTYIPHEKGKVVVFSSSFTLKDKYLQMFDNKQLFENIFNFLSTEKTQETEQDQKVKIIKKRVPKQKKEISTEKPPEKKAAPSIEKVTEHKIEKKSTTPIIKQEPEEKITEESIEKKIDELDEKLALGHIDEPIYELEIAKVKEDTDKLKELFISKKIDLKTYISASKTIKSKDKQTCSQCGWELIGIEAFCPNCGVKIS